MKTIKLTLLTLTFIYFFHAYNTIYNNILCFSYLKSNHRDAYLNDMGKIFLKNIPTKKLDPISYNYTSLTGTCRGYAFFSPNIRNTIRDFLIKRDGNIIHPMSTFESSLKLNTLNTNLIDLIKTEKTRKIIIKGIYSNSDPNNIPTSIDIKLKKVNSFEIFKTTGSKDSTRIINGYQISY